MIFLNKIRKLHHKYGVPFRHAFLVSRAEGSGNSIASFTTRKATNITLQRIAKILSCFLDIQKALDRVWNDGL